MKIEIDCDFQLNFDDQRPLTFKSVGQNDDSQPKSDGVSKLLSQKLQLQT